MYLTSYDKKLFSSSLDGLFNTVINGRLDSFSADETDKEVTITLPLVGYKQADLNVEIQESTLTVTANNEKRGKFVKAFSLWIELDKEKTTAKLEDGLLTIVLPKLVKSSVKVKVQ